MQLTQQGGRRVGRFAADSGPDPERHRVMAPGLRRLRPGRTMWTRPLLTPQLDLTGKRIGQWKVRNLAIEGRWQSSQRVPPSIATTRVRVRLRPRTGTRTATSHPSSLLDGISPRRSTSSISLSGLECLNPPHTFHLSPAVLLRGAWGRRGNGVGWVAATGPFVPSRSCIAGSAEQPCCLCLRDVSPPSDHRSSGCRR